MAADHLERGETELILLPTARASRLRVSSLLVAIALVVYATLGNAINDQNSGTAAKVKGASQKSFPF